MTDFARTNGGAPAPRPPPLLKYKSWSPDTEREEVWLRRKGIHKDRRRAGRLSRSVTDEEINELRGCIDLGFGFELDLPGSGERSSRLTDAFPALDLYYAVNRSVIEGGSAGQPLDSASEGSSPLSIYSPGESPQQVKTKLKQWAQVVACSVRQCC